MDFSPHLAILFNLLKPKIDLAFSKFYFKFHLESEESPMAKVVHLFKSRRPVFLFQFLVLWKVVFGPNPVDPTRQLPLRLFALCASAQSRLLPSRAPHEHPAYKTHRPPLSPFFPPPVEAPTAAILPHHRQ
jgi:hypothetical protein